MGSQGEITILLRHWQAGKVGAYEEVVAWTYQRLLAMAGGIISRSGLSTEPAALVHEGYLRLREIGRMEWRNRDHFFCVAANLFRRILIDQARGRSAQKRGGWQQRIPLSEELSWIDLEGEQILDLDCALNDLEKFDSGLVRLVELRYLMGCTVPEIVELCGTSRATVERRLRFARTWLFDRLNSAPS